MKTIGLIGGMSFESTMEYYRIINEEVNKKLKSHHSAKILIYSFDFEELLELRYELPRVGDMLSKAAQILEKGGADCILICANTMHVLADEVQSRITIPILNIIDATAQEIKKRGITKVGLLGTQFTMEEEFYKGRLTDKHDIQVIAPDEADRKMVHDIIFNELCVGQFKASSKEKLLSAMNKLGQEGAQGIILGCTELPLIIKEGDTKIPQFNTTFIHANLAVKFATEF